MKRPETLAGLVQSFFEQHLASDRNLKPNTVLSYRDAMKLFLNYAATSKKCSPDALALDDLDAGLVRSFLNSLERKRGCGTRTRNHRLAVLKTFFRYVATNAPAHLERCRQIREIPRRRHDLPDIEFLEEEEVRSILQAAGARTGPAADRDLALLLLLYNTGARVQEVVDLNLVDLRLDAAPFVRLHGKGGKRRTCPLWTRTAQALGTWVGSRTGIRGEDPLFVNAHGSRLSRSGIAYILARAGRQANIEPPRRARRLTPHIIRHTTAMHLLRARVDITLIAAWLGHAQLSTTHGYVEIDLRMKQEALAKANLLPELQQGTYPPDDVITWLERLGRCPRYAQSRATGGLPEPTRTARGT